LDRVPLLRGGLLCTHPSPAVDIRKEKKRTEKKRNEKTMPFGVNREAKYYTGLPRVHLM